MKKQTLELVLANSISELTMKALQEGKKLIKVERGGLNGATQILYFTTESESDYYAILVRKQGAKTFEMYSQDFVTVSVYQATLSQEEYANKFIDIVFENANKELVVEVSAIMKSHDTVAYVFENEEEKQAIIALRKKRYNNITYTDKKSLGRKKLESVVGFKRGRTEVFREMNGYLLMSENGKTKRVSLVY